MKTSFRLIFAGSVALAALTLAGCTEGGPGPDSATSDQTVGSRSSHDIYNSTDRPMPQQPGATPGVITENAADKAIDSTHGPGAFGGTSQENAGSGTPGGISGSPASNSGPNPPVTPSQNTPANNTGTSNQNNRGNLQLNAGPGTTANGNGNTNNGQQATPAQPANGNGTNQPNMNGNTSNAGGAGGSAPASTGGR